MDELLQVAKAAAKAAGIEILKYYKQEVSVLHKTDGSPLTLADKAAHIAIYQVLSTTSIVVVSEEGDDLHLDAVDYWLVDPLDGTKDFLAANDEFTVNIALIKNGEPILGVIYAPALDQMYWGLDGVGSGLESKGASNKINLIPNARQMKMAISRFHDHEDVSKFGNDNGINIRVPVGSALKYGLLATGEVDVFPRLVGSSEWDVAAGHAILTASGGVILDWHSGKPLKYGKENRRNPRLISFRAPYKLTDFKLRTFEYELL